MIAAASTDIRALLLLGMPNRVGSRYDGVQQARAEFGSLGNSHFVR
ncbi:hypothetical protein GFS60_05034 [Rhodococcus sp. WAY2]|nr:hypothetical protein GFS60_05034 [Rhodococcus sp. WAY2]